MSVPPTPTIKPVAIVTGASRGLGREIVKHLATAGFAVAAVARDLDALRETCDQSGGDATPYAADLAQLDQLPSLVKRIGDDHAGTIDVLVNNAAIQGPMGLFDELDFDAWRAVFDANLFAPMRLCQLVLPAMRQRRRGKIINLSGGGATAPRPHVTAYAGSKVAMARLTETLAIEYKPFGIDINAVAPGAMNTNMLQETLAAKLPFEHDKAVQQQQTGGAPPAMAAELVAWLASPTSNGITGKLISALWDGWRDLPAHKADLEKFADLYTLRRIIPKDRGLGWE
jgi:NAD(P)-dependent dehydrogenase (short-subunit alcohol dehydrogenase family)